MSRLKDLTGQRFGRLTVVERADNNKKGQARWLCKCDCGNEITTYGSALRNGNTKSCGCTRKEKFTTRTHGLCHSRSYRIWGNIKSRCFNPKSTSYAIYGGRGVTMCSRWKNDFSAFLKDVSTLEHFGEKGYTLDRINGNGDYEPSNVRWATDTEQARNTRKNVIVEYQGDKITLPEAAEKSGINYRTLLGRYHRGDTGDRLFRPVGSK